MTIAPLMLGVSGCRGVVGASLTPTVVAEFAGSFGGWLVERGGGGRPLVAIGADGRAGFQAVHAAAVGGLLGSGCDVVDLGIATTPSVGVMVDHLGAAAGVVLTASHNPQQWNGMKFLLSSGGGAAAPDAQAAAVIVGRYQEGGAARVASWDRVGRLSSDPTAASVHVGRVLRAIDDLGAGTGGPTLGDRIRAARFTVVLDSVGGAGRMAGRLLLERLGCRVVHLGDEGTGLFWHTPEPTRENLAPVMERLAGTGAALAFCQDPDADRLALIDGDGVYIGEEYTLALGAMAVLGLGGAAAPVLAANLSTSRMIDDVVVGHGGRVVRSAVGEANVVAAMRREGSPVGGEGNGGVIWPAVTWVRDSLGSMALILALMASRGASLRALAADIPAYAIEKRKIDIPSREAAAPVIAAIRASLGSEPGARADTQDGVRIDLSGPSWIHVRASNTEPIMRLIAEAPTPSAARALLDRAESAIPG